MGSDGIPTTALRAYHSAAHRELTLDAKCGLSWPLLAAIGRVESDHGRFGGALLHTDGVSTPRIIGIALNGHGTARILDTDHGRLDADTVFDRAVGPMQFIPSTWVGSGVDGNGDGVIDPFNIFDAAAASAHYLCVAGGNMRTLAGQTRAVRAYNDSDAYVALVLRLERVYALGVPGLTVPIPPTGPAVPTRRATVPPANPGPPLGAGSTSLKKPTPSRSGATSHRASPSLSSTAVTLPTATSPSTTTPDPSGTSCPTASASASASDSPSTRSSDSPSGPTPNPPGPPIDSTRAGKATSSSSAGTGASTSSSTSLETSPSC